MPSHQFLLPREQSSLQGDRSAAHEALAIRDGTGYNTHGTLDCRVAQIAPDKMKRTQGKPKGQGTAETNIRLISRLIPTERSRLRTKEKKK